MLTGETRFACVKNKLPHFSHVVLAIECPSESPGIIFNCSGNGFISQGYLEEASATGYDDWKDGARAGVSFALSVAARPACRVEISKIEGLTTDTNPTIVAYAAALAVWKAFGLEPPKEIIERTELIVFSSWKAPHDQIPKFV